MSTAQINGLRSIELGVHDLQKSAEFYRRVWALEDVAADGDTIHMRGTGREHHVITLRERPRAGHCSECISRRPIAPRWTHCMPRPRRWAPRSAMRRAQLPSQRRRRLRLPGHHAGGPSAVDLVGRHAARRSDRRPRAADQAHHVVLNSAEVEKQTAFFLDVLGFKWSDSTFMMDFVRCCSDHHSVAFARGNGPSLNHMAYEMPSIDGLMSGAGRVRKSGYEILWGVGSHGPGSNVFSLFRRAERLRHRIHHRGRAGRRQLRHARRGVVDGAERFSVPLEHGGAPSPFARKAMSGELYEEEDQRCEQVMAKAPSAADLAADRRRGAHRMRAGLCAPRSCPPHAC